MPVAHADRIQPPRIRRQDSRVVRLDTEWQRWADCTHHDPDLFYSFDLDEQAAARLICLTCPVMDRCLADVRTWPADLRNVGMVAGGRYWSKRSRHQELEDESAHAQGPVRNG